MAKGPRIEWTIPPSKLARNVEDYGDRIMTAVTELSHIIASEAERDMKNNAPWTDHTAHARSNLRGLAERSAQWIVTIYLVTGAEYGKWLELRWGGRYAIIMPTIERLRPEINRKLKNLLG